MPRIQPVEDPKEWDALVRKSPYTSHSHLASNPLATDRWLCESDGQRYLFAFRDERGVVSSFDSYCAGLVPLDEFTAGSLERALDDVREALRARGGRLLRMTVRAPHASLRDHTPLVHDWFRRQKGYGSVEYALVLDATRPFQEVWEGVLDRKARNVIRKAEKAGLATEVLPDPLRHLDDLMAVNHSARERQGRPMGRDYLERDLFERKLRRLEALGSDGRFYATLHEGRVVSYMMVNWGPNDARIFSILSHRDHWSLAPNNAMMARLTADCCADARIREILYDHAGGLYEPTSLDEFRYSMGFRDVVEHCLMMPLRPSGRLALLPRFLQPLHRVARDLQRGNLYWRRLDRRYRLPRT